MFSGKCSVLSAVPCPTCKRTGFWEVVMECHGNGTCLFFASSGGTWRPREMTLEASCQLPHVFFFFSVHDDAWWRFSSQCLLRQWMHVRIPGVRTINSGNPNLFRDSTVSLTVVWSSTSSHSMYRHTPDHHPWLDFYYQERSGFLGHLSIARGELLLCIVETSAVRARYWNRVLLLLLSFWGHHTVQRHQHIHDTNCDIGSYRMSGVMQCLNPMSSLVEFLICLRWFPLRHHHHHHHDLPSWSRLRLSHSTVPVISVMVWCSILSMCAVSSNSMCVSSVVQWTSVWWYEILHSYESYEKFFLFVSNVVQRSWRHDVLRFSDDIVWSFKVNCEDPSFGCDLTWYQSVNVYIVCKCAIRSRIIPLYYTSLLSLSSEIDAYVLVETRFSDLSSVSLVSSARRSQCQTTGLPTIECRTSASASQWTLHPPVVGWLNVSIVLHFVYLQILSDPTSIICPSDSILRSVSLSCIPSLL